MFIFDAGKGYPPHMGRKEEKGRGNSIRKKKGKKKQRRPVISWVCGGKQLQQWRKKRVRPWQEREGKARGAVGKGLWLAQSKRMKGTLDKGPGKEEDVSHKGIRKSS